jgi:DNA helicase-2/ATP-dependent DNA helicase PcrA
MTETITLDDMETMEAPPPRLTWKPSPYQQAIFDWIKTGSGDALVNAVAGSGKTTTLVRASEYLGNGKPVSALFCAFNAHIAKELAQRVSGMECKTIHSMGLQAVTKHLGAAPKVEGTKYSQIIRRESRGLGYADFYSTLSDLVDYCQATLTSPRDEQAMQDLIRHFGLAMPCEYRELKDTVIAILQAGLEQAKNEHVISFSEMLWLPHVWKLEPRKFDWVFVDECQDLNAAQLELVLKMRNKPHVRAMAVPNANEPMPDMPWLRKGRMIFVGDPRQAIYGFSGADARSYANIRERTGAVEFPLSVSYRCPVLVVREAQAIVPQIEPRAGAELGSVRYDVTENSLFSHVKEGDLIVCRMTAPLVSLCLDLIRQGVPARVRGREIGRMLTAIVGKVAKITGFTYKEFPKFLHEHIKAQIEKLSRKEGNEAQIERLWDSEAALMACYETINADDTERLCVEIAYLFSDDRPGVWLSTVHKAKGLEEDRVFILKPSRLPLVWKGQQSWEREQELNLKYVAVTRAKKELFFVREELS